MNVLADIGDFSGYPNAFLLLTRTLLLTCCDPILPNRRVPTAVTVPKRPELPKLATPRRIRFRKEHARAVQVFGGDMLATSIAKGFHVVSITTAPGGNAPTIKSQVKK